MNGNSAQWLPSAARSLVGCCLVLAGCSSTQSPEAGADAGAPAPSADGTTPLPAWLDTNGDNQLSYEEYRAASAAIKRQ